MARCSAPSPTFSCKNVLSAPALLGAYAKHWQLAMGSLIVLIVLALPHGLAGLFDRHGRCIPTQ